MTLREATVWVILAATCAPPAASADEPVSIAEQRMSLGRSDLVEPPEPRRKSAPVAVPLELSNQRSPFSGMTSPWSPAAEGVGTNHPLPPPRRSNSYDESAVSDRSARWLAERIGAVMAIFFALVLAQRWLPRKRQSLPHGSVQVCGKVPLDSHQSIHLVRLGQRLLVLLESPQGMQCVAEITDPSEVRRLLEAEAPDSEIRAAVNVRQVLSTFRQRASFPA